MALPSTPLRIGFVGLGTMGLPMARRLAGHGHALTVLDRAGERVRCLLDHRRGVAVAGDLAGLSDGPDVILTCLPSLEAVEEVYLGAPSALARTVRPGTMTIDHSTVTPTLARAIHHECAERGVVHVEAPLFGGATDAAEGKLFLALSGSEAALEDGQPIRPLRAVVEAVARGWRWVGGPGAAMAAKVLQNGLGLVQLVAMAEVAAACRTQGIDPRLFHRLTMEAGGMAASPLFEHRFSLMDLGSETVEARLAIGAKDSKLHRDLIGGVAADFSPASASAAAFAAALAAGLEDADVTAVWRVFEKVKPIPADPIP